MPLSSFQELGFKTVLIHSQAQKDLVRNEWQKFLNLCICQETHLDNVEEFKRVNTEQHSPDFSTLDNGVWERTSQSLHGTMTHSGAPTTLKTTCFVPFFQYQLETEQLSETLTNLNKSLDPKSVSKKSNPETLLQLEVQGNISNLYSISKT